ncbi:hypothetical protein B0H14DRAFT_3131900 [Mycena olivaceomarginata]|nr:hypothetical protein B0H14DRAFT_3131900 [Mycena olivaceomarginata]
MPLPPPADSCPPFPFSPLTLPISSHGYLPSPALISSSSSYAASVDRVEARSGVASVCRPDSVLLPLGSGVTVLGARSITSSAGNPNLYAARSRGAFASGSGTVSTSSDAFTCDVGAACHEYNTITILTRLLLA